MTVESMSSDYPCMPVKTKRANVSHSSWEKCIYPFAKKSKVNFEKTFLWNNRLEREFQCSISTSLFTYAVEKQKERKISTYKCICTTK